jgi:L-aminopeptidase/D-esterase-like protein
MYKGNITDIKGVLAGHVTDEKGKTGCTVVLFGDGAVAGVDVRGAAPGTRETDLLKPGNTVEKIHAVLLAGGSAFGLDAATGVMRWLEEHDIGFDTMVAKVPIVPAAVLFDLAVGDPKARPDAAMGYAACQGANESDLPQGAVGAGTGATVGKLLGPMYAMTGGVGTAAMKTSGGATVAAVVAVNALGDVIDYTNNKIIAGVRLPAGIHPGCMGEQHPWDATSPGCMGEQHPEDATSPGAQAILASGKMPDITGGTNTTIGVVVTDAKLTKVQANRLATIAHDGLSWSIRPVHTALDGDTLFAASYGDREADFNAVCATAVEVVARAVNNAVEVKM